MIHSTAIISTRAVIGDSVEIGPFTIIYDNVVIADHCKIGPNCELGIDPQGGGVEPLLIGANSTIRSGSVFYSGSQFGEGLVTGHKVTVREDIKAGQSLQIGSYCDIQSQCRFGHYVKMHSNVHVGQGCDIEDYVWLFPYVLIVNDPHPPSSVEYYTQIKKYAVIGAKVLLMPGSVVESEALVAAGSVISGIVTKGELFAGAPAKRICRADQIPLRDGSRRAAYPWRRHFHRGYPEKVVKEWLEEFK